MHDCVHVGLWPVEELDFLADQRQEVQMAAHIRIQRFIEAVRSLEGEDVVNCCVAAQVACQQHGEVSADLIVHSHWRLSMRRPSARVRE